MFPQARHQLCQWHISRNAVSNIHIEGFEVRFNECMRERCSYEEFEALWASLLDDFELHNNQWMREMYDTRQLWAEAYLRDHFFADMTTTQRSESMNSYMKQFVKYRMRLYEFVKTYERALARLRNNEAKAHNETDQTEPVMSTILIRIERHAAAIYTRKIFKKF